MSQVMFTKWHPSVGNIPGFPNFKWDEVMLYEHDRDWLTWVNMLITLHFYVGIHWDVDTNIITIAVDTTWFRTR